jgi:esterase/lipase superfamily enzyme
MIDVRSRLSVALLTRGAIFIVALAGATGCAVAPKKTAAPDLVEVFYVTTRAYSTTEPNLAKSFMNMAADKQKPRYGVAIVEVANPHQEGELDDARIAAFQPPLQEDGLSKAQFRWGARAQLGTNPHRPLLVYVHGFNNSFDVAARRAAVFAHDLAPLVASKPAIFSWPSAQKILRYASDEDSALLNQDRSREFLNYVRDPGGVSPIVLVGHSLGARVLTYALRDFALIRDAHRAGGRGPMFKHLILIQPDVNTEYLEQNMPRISKLCQQVTIYSSNKDWPLRISRWLHNSGRAGQYRYARKVVGADVIDATSARMDFLGHSYDGPPLFDDLRALLSGKKVEERIGVTLEGDLTRGLALKKR